MPPGRGRLEGRVALVTGAASGMGAATSRAMVREGARVVVCDIQDALGEALVQTLRDEGGEASYAQLDVARADDWQSACQLAQALYGGVDVLVNNAGVFLGKSFEEATLADWQRLCDVNLTGVVLGIRSLLPTLRERAAAREHGTSAIVNLSSVAGLVGTAADPLYSLTKGGITMLTKSLAIDFGQRAYRIRVNSVHPGTIDTAMGAQAVDVLALGASRADTDAARRRLVRAHPLGRLGLADDIAQAVLYLACDDAAFVTGASLAVDGGFTAQ